MASPFSESIVDAVNYCITKAIDGQKLCRSHVIQLYAGKYLRSKHYPQNYTTDNTVSWKNKKEPGKTDMMAGEYR
jgi:hypothetical protein